MSEESIFETTIRKRNPAERDVFPGGACGGNAKVRRHDETLARARQHVLERALIQLSSMLHGEQSPDCLARECRPRHRAPLGRQAQLRV